MIFFGVRAKERLLGDRWSTCRNYEGFNLAASPHIRPLYHTHKSSDKDVKRSTSSSLEPTTTQNMSWFWSAQLACTNGYFCTYSYAASLYDVFSDMPDYTDNYINILGLQIFENMINDSFHIFSLVQIPYFSKWNNTKQWDRKSVMCKTFFFIALTYVWMTDSISLVCDISLQL